MNLLKLIAPKNRILQEGDIIALLKNDSFFGYASVYAVLEESVILDVEKRACKIFNELHYEDILYDLVIE